VKNCRRHACGLLQIILNYHFVCYAYVNGYADITEDLLPNIFKCFSTLYPQKRALTSPTSSGCSIGIVRSRTKATEIISYLI
jgi:hypothetical protein